MKRRFRIQSSFNLNVIQMFSKYIQVPEYVMTYIFVRDWSQVYLNLTGPEWIACSMLSYRPDQNLMIFNLLHFIWGSCVVYIAVQPLSKSLTGYAPQLVMELCTTPFGQLIECCIYYFCITWPNQWLVLILDFFYYKKCKLSLLSFNFLLQAVAWL